MPNLKRNLIALLVASSCLVTGQESIAELHIIMLNSDDIELSEQEKRLREERTGRSSAPQGFHQSRREKAVPTSRLRTACRLAGT